MREGLTGTAATPDHHLPATAQPPVRRETTAPEWTHMIPAGDVTTHQVDLSKDNVFGVRAVNRAGNRSPVAFPAPQS